MSNQANGAHRQESTLPALVPVKLAGIVCELNAMLEQAPIGSPVHVLMHSARNSLNLALSMPHTSREGQA